MRLLRRLIAMIHEIEHGQRELTTANLDDLATAVPQRFPAESRPP